MLKTALSLCIIVTAIALAVWFVILVVLTIKWIIEGR